MNKINTFRGQYYFLSNFYEVPVTYQGLTYQNNEAAFQAQKTLDRKLQESFTSLNASEAKKLGRKVALRKDWEVVKYNVMKEIVEAKFMQHPDLAERLLATGDCYLEEGNTWGDRIWGTVDGKGANLLGQILMETRDMLKNKVLEEEMDEVLEI